MWGPALCGHGARRQWVSWLRSVILFVWSHAGGSDSVWGALWVGHGVGRQWVSNLASEVLYCGALGMLAE